ncbi:hypothetical protein QTP86_008828 [Hemibagrus guttatus]|nr:hypothetical protein QTP86_008828 [Hemibagrus guttatus]
MEEYIEEAPAVGHIRPSTSPAAAGFFFVGKKDRGLRPCIDYRGLNTITVRYPYPLPLVPAALEQLRGAKFFTKLDLCSAYNLVRIREGDEWKTAFHTTHGHYEYLIMPFGLTNAPAVFQSLINEVFQDILGKWVSVYIDDILVYSTSLEEHVHHVRAVLSRLQQNHLYVKPEKCEFHRTTITFLGYVISRQRVEMDLTKVQAVAEWPNPTTVEEWSRLSQEVWERAHVRLQRAVRRQRIQANRRRRPHPPYWVGQRVWLSTRNLKLKLPCRKLSLKFVGPFEIIRQVNPVCYRLRHVSLLKPAHSPGIGDTDYVEPPPPLDIDGSPAYRVHALLDSRRVRSRLQYLVDWEGYGPEECSWVDAVDILDPSLTEDFHRDLPGKAAPWPRG